MSHNFFAIDLPVTSGVVTATVIQTYVVFVVVLMEILGCYFEMSER